jgi:hypothetical protein
VVVDDAAGKRGEDRQQGEYTKDLAFHLFSPGAVSARGFVRKRRAKRRRT